MGTHVVVSKGVVVNVIVVDDIQKFQEEAAEFCKQFDSFLEIKNTPGDPGVGWICDDKQQTFTHPDDPKITANAKEVVVSRLDIGK